jgi:hypothetical protein
VGPALTPGQAQLRAREHGATAGFKHQAGHKVFASSVAPTRATATKPATPAPSAATAVGNIENGFATPTKPTSLAAASAAGATNGGGLSSSVIAGLVLLALGLVALSGGVAVAATRQQRKVRAGSSDTR